MIAQAAQEPGSSAAQNELIPTRDEAATDGGPNSHSTDEPEPAITVSTRIMRSGANREFNRSLLALCDTYPAGARPRTLQALCDKAFDRYKRGGLTPEQLAAFVGRFYEAIGVQEVACHEHAAWLLHMKQKNGHWLRLGFSKYRDYLASIDPYGNVRRMIVQHRQTLDRKACSKKALEGHWEGYHELLELVTPEEGEERWRTLAALAKATDGAPEVAKYCLNMAMLERFQCNLARTWSFTVQDFVVAEKMAERIDRASRPWDDETYEGSPGTGLRSTRALPCAKRSIRARLTDKGL